MDVNMVDKSDSAMKEGVRNSTCVIAIITGTTEKKGCAYWEHEYCIRELRWAINEGTAIQPVVRLEDKTLISSFIKALPADLQQLGQVDFIDLNRTDVEYWNVGVNKV